MLNVRGIIAHPPPGRQDLFLKNGKTINAGCVVSQIISKKVFFTVDKMKSLMLECPAKIKKDLSTVDKSKKKEKSHDYK